MFKLVGKYLTSSTIATLIDWLIFYILSTCTGLLYIISYIISFGTGFIVKFILNKEFTFVIKEYNKKMFLSYCLVNVGTFILGAILMWLFVDVIHLVSFTGRVWTTIIVFIYNFLMDKKFVFVKK